MTNTASNTARIDGPEVDGQTGKQTYTVHGEERDICFSVWPRQGDGGRTVWEVSIEGVPEPGIVHEDAWTTPEEARQAALEAINAMLGLARIQQDDQPSAPVESSESCVDQTGALEVEDSSP